VFIGARVRCGKHDVALQADDLAWFVEGVDLFEQIVDELGSVCIFAVAVFEHGVDLLFFFALLVAAGLLEDLVFDCTDVDALELDLEVEGLDLVVHLEGHDHVEHGHAEQGLEQRECVPLADQQQHSQLESVHLLDLTLLQFHPELHRLHRQQKQHRQRSLRVLHYQREAGLSPDKHALEQQFATGTDVHLVEDCAKQGEHEQSEQLGDVVGLLDEVGQEPAEVEHEQQFLDAVDLTRDHRPEQPRFVLLDVHARVAKQVHDVAELVLQDVRLAQCARLRVLE